jgi:rhodanese-related sulfurtransferase
MKNLHTKLENYAERCDALLLNAHLKELISQALEQLPQISPETLHSILEEYIMIDVREPEEFASGYILGREVLTIPRGKLEFMALEKIGKRYGTDAKIVTYCLKGPRGILAARQLQKLGFSNVSNLEGGILNWLAKGNTIHTYLGEMKLVSS